MRRPERQGRYVSVGSNGNVSVASVSHSRGSRRDQEEGGGAGLRKLDFFRFGLFLNSSATGIVLVTLPSTAVETAIAQYTSRCAMASGHRLNTSIVLTALHGLFRAVSAVEPSFFRPHPTPVPVPNNPSRFCGRKAKCTRTHSVRHHF